MPRKRSSFGSVRKLPSGRWQARYTTPGGRVVTAPATFGAKIDADAWLKNVRADFDRGKWRPADAERTTLAAYSATWLASRLVRGRPLKPRTAEGYRRLLDRIILPALGTVPIAQLSPDLVRSWHGKLDPATPTQNAHAYALLKAICATAVDDELLSANPCRIRGAGTTRRASKTEPATVAELAALIDAMPPRFRAMTALAGWCGLRFGELIELRRHDVDLKTGTVRVHRAAVLVRGEYVVGEPKSDAGIRDVAIPPHVVPLVRDHLRAMPVAGRDALLFPALTDHTAHLRTATLARPFYKARESVGRPDLRWHDLRHTGAIMATAAGASLAEVMARLGHSTPSAAMRYQHAVRGRDQEIAARLSELAKIDAPRV